MKPNKQKVTDALNTLVIRLSGEPASVYENTINALADALCPDEAAGALPYREFIADGFRGIFKISPGLEGCRVFSLTSGAFVADGDSEWHTREQLIELTKGAKIYVLEGVCQQ
jgi:hypothetical protein